ncbi:Tripartite ATP-independent periplasmic transporter DctQ component [Chloroherpeton thalassium ATCC 35110]|uniref:Tripartite ATP-independent periplasmic transporter DctQ component n=1 Tax=Chloroherpeton thalassium (strain ATCC 35110 / GB-78) TaxID=517418 RepID=B3QTZ9_CHLT3|nr:TRAP transporter small permease subunit [Chloroherpeton thalassium]ACF12797.1 Tripartite ATP-independent periplasmic transporter DctQ component [Chloroherpeton thalassium ATCC 35110]
MDFAKSLVRAIDRLSEFVGRVVSWLTTLLVLVVVYDVFTRYFLKTTIVAIQEFEWHLFSLIFLLAASYTLKHDKHVRVDVFYARFSKQQQAWVNLLGGIFFLIPFALMVIFASQNFVINSFVIGETSPDPGGLPARYLLKAAIPIGFFLLLLQAFSLAVKSALSIAGVDMGGKETTHA